MFVNYKRTFNLPNFQGRYLKQGTSGTYGSESLPNITGGSNIVGYPDQGTGAIRNGSNPLPETTNAWIGADANNASVTYISFNASWSSTTYQDNAKVNPDNAEILYCIKILVFNTTLN